MLIWSGNCCAQVCTMPVRRFDWVSLLRVVFATSSVACIITLCKRVSKDILRENSSLFAHVLQCACLKRSFASFESLCVWTLYVTTFCQRRFSCRAHIEIRKRRKLVWRLLCVLQSDQLQLNAFVEGPDLTKFGFCQYCLRLVIPSDVCVTLNG